MPTKTSFESQIPDALAATGFVVEHEVSEAFRAAKWSVIGSRYYIDDVDGRARELDLIAYKVMHGRELDVVTTLLISCKKDNKNAWTIMSRKRPVQDPNLDWSPVHPWTNDELLGAYLGSVAWAQKYVSGNKMLYTQLFEMTRQAFAFQLVNKESCRPANDKPIFESLTDLMKAQDHELSILPDRMKKKRVYSFNLMSLVDTDIYEVRYDKDPPEVIKVDEFRHLARYIVRRQDQVARINICSKDKLHSFVKVYDELAIYDEAFFNDMVKDAFKSWPENKPVRNVFEKELTKILKYEIMSALLRAKRKGKTSDISLSPGPKKDELAIELSLEDDDIDALATDAKLMNAVRASLKKVMHYDGNFRLEADEIPF